MTLNRSNWLYKYAYFMTDWKNKPDGGVSLCTFFWRCVFLQPIKIGLVGFAGWVILNVGFLEPYQNYGLIGLGFVPGGVVGVFLLVWLIFSFLDSDFISFIKGKFCPTVRIEK